MIFFPVGFVRFFPFHWDPHGSPCNRENENEKNIDPWKL